MDLFLLALMLSPQAVTQLAASKAFRRPTMSNQLIFLGVLHSAAEPPTRFPIVRCLHP
jgi:hypothetical protein